MRFSPNLRRIAAIHDLSGVGRTSLLAVIPILSTMGFNVCPLPTAILSNHSQYPDFSFLDLTDEMPKIIAAKNRALAGKMAPANGLYLYKVYY